MVSDARCGRLKKVLETLESMQQTLKDYLQGCEDRERKRGKGRSATIKAKKENLVQKLSK